MLQVHQLSYRYAGASQALSFPDFEAEQGAQVLVRGPSGSGKSSLLALIAGLLKAEGGRLRVGSADLQRLTPAQTDAWRGRELGFVPQRLHLSAGLDVQANLALPYIAAAQPVDTARITALMRRLGIAELARRRPHALSLGQAQRVALARAVLRRPKVLLADEPTAHLDDAATQAVIHLLTELAREEHCTLVVATHDSRVAAAWAGAAVWSLAAPADNAAQG